ncbi:hypothetical protein [Cellulomonas fimi]|uniref:SipW-cognate class signal peptide n=1 Tax=Cellulomonas fimi TaxID=1708 RepID=A0A7Y0QHC4_CELFI|nr:hypothetical protein [Cellulomonas fimi]NMR19754.1 hypothetical protein [Cellulomonas fimi]
MDDLLQEMIRPAGPSAADRARRRRFVASAATVGLAVVGVSSLTTSALFRDNDDAGVSGFTTGSVSISGTPVDEVITTDPLVAPGDTSYAVLDVLNDGSLEHRYAIEYAATNRNSAQAPADRPVPDLASVVDIGLYALPTGAACDAAFVASAQPLVPVQKLAAGAENVLLGSRTDGVQGGERTLIAGASEQLCVSLGLPIGAGNEYADATTDLVFTFFAEQTKNN